MFLNQFTAQKYSWSWHDDRASWNHARQRCLDAPHGHAEVSHYIFGWWLLPASWLQEQSHAIRKTYVYFKCENNPIPTFVMLLVSSFG